MIRDPSDIENARLRAENDDYKKQIANLGAKLERAHAGPLANKIKALKRYDELLDRYYTLRVHYGWGVTAAMKGAAAGIMALQTFKNRRSEGDRNDIIKTDEAIEETIQERAEELAHLAIVEKGMVARNDVAFDPGIDALLRYRARVECRRKKLEQELPDTDPRLLQLAAERGMKSCELTEWLTICAAAWGSGPEYDEKVIKF